MTPYKLKLSRMLRVFCALAIVCAFLVDTVAITPASAAPMTGSGVFALEPTPPSVVPDDGRYQVAAGFFERLFKRRSKSKSSTKSKGTKSNSKNSGAKTKRKRTASAPPAVKTVAKDPDAAVIAVFGDEFSQDIARGLQDAFANTSDVKVEIHSVPRTGLVHRAKRNPLVDPQTLFAKKPFNFAVIMVGLNDRVKMRAKKNDEGVEIFPPYEFKSEGWARSYQREIDRLRLAFALQDKPVFWVGLPPVANKKLSADLLYLNDFVSERLTERGERFIDIWDAFSNEDGTFSYRGPDLSGQQKRLRQKNGIRFNRAGRRKLAFFVEKLVIRALSQTVAEDVLPDDLLLADETALREGRGAGRDIYVLRKPSLDSDKLIEPVAHKGPDIEVGTDAARLRSAQRAPEYRVDNFSWDNSQ